MLHKVLLMRDIRVVIQRNRQRPARLKIGNFIAHRNVARLLTIKRLADLQMFGSLKILPKLGNGSHCCAAWFAVAVNLHFKLNRAAYLRYTCVHIVIVGARA